MNNFLTHLKKYRFAILTLAALYPILWGISYLISFIPIPTLRVILTYLISIIFLGAYVYLLVDLWFLKIPQFRKIAWTIAFFIAGVIALPVYWFLYVYKDPLIAPF
jgi:hypothetical protein